MDLLQELKDWASFASRLHPTHLLAALAFGTISFLVTWALVDYARVLRLRRKLPPGPFPLPLLGSFFQIPKYKPWVTWERMSKEYNNPMITLWNGHRPVIVCNDAWTISDLLEKRAAIYSSRPRLVTLADLPETTYTNQIALGYGDRWRLHRRLMVSSYRPERCTAFTLLNPRPPSIPLWGVSQFVSTAHSRETKPKS